MNQDILLEVIGLKKWFPIRRSVLETLFSRHKTQYVQAVDGISFQVNRGEIFGLVGESGCGKTTTGRLILRLIEPTNGEIYYKNKNIFQLEKNELKNLRCEMQMIFQDPYESLSPRRNIHDLIAEPLEIHKIYDSPEAIEEKIISALESVDLPTNKDFIIKYPSALSGGQRQRVALARSLILDPQFIIADEPVSMLDASIKGSILNLLLRLREEWNLTSVLITHDFSVAWNLCDRIGVMYLGKIVEIGSTEAIIRKAQHPYTKALVSAVPTLDLSTKCYEMIDQVIKGEISSAVNPPQGCQFHPRCNYAKSVCSHAEPEMIEVEKDHHVACHLFGTPEK